MTITSCKDVKIEDNFLAQTDFDKIQTMMMGHTFPWFLNLFIDSVTDVDKFQFIHVFYKDKAPCSNHIKNMIPILTILDPTAIYRIKSNLLIKTSSIIENKFHSDLSSVLKEDQRAHWITSIFYVNTNNGYTKFENGMKVESVANRMVSFPANMEHKGTTCTDEQTRVVVNFNYFK